MPAFKFWFHYVPFGLLALFTVVELGLTGDWTASDLPYGGRAGFAVFVSVWTFLSLLAHWTFPFIVAGIWAIVTSLLWLVAGAVLASADCYTYGDLRVCIQHSNRWASMVAFAFMNMLFCWALLPCFWWHVKRKEEASWRDGIYGRSYYLKPRAGKSGVTA